MAEAQPVQSGMVRFVLVGQREGFSGYVSGGRSSRHRFGFSNGVCTLPFQEAEMSKQRLAFFAAYPEGSQELMDAQAKWRDRDGGTKTPPVPSEVRPAGEESPQGTGTAQGSEDAGAAGRESGSVPDRDGHERTPRSMSIADAVQVLDHSKDDQWTTEGKPKIPLIKQLCKDPTITRAEIDAVGVVRTTQPETQ